MADALKKDAAASYPGDPQAAAAAYDAMNDDDKHAVADLVKQGQTPRSALRAVRSKALQAKAFGSDSSPEVPDEEPATREKATSFAEGVADSLGARVSPIAMGLGAAATSPGLGFTDAFKWGYNNQREKVGEAANQAPGAFGGGGLTGDFVNAAMGLAGPAKSAATAIEDVAAGAKAGDVVSSGLPDLKAIARKLVPSKVPTPTSALQSALDKLHSALAEPAYGLPSTAPTARPIPAGYASPTLEVDPADIVGAELADAGESIPLARPPRVPTDAVDEVRPPTPAALPPWAQRLLGSAKGRPIAPDEIIPPSSPQPAQTSIRGALPSKAGPSSPKPAPRSALHDAVEALSPKPPDMPADVMAAEVPKAVTAARPPKIGGSGEQLTGWVKSLPSGQRVDAIHRIAADMGKDIAAAVAKAAGVSLKLKPL